MVTVHDEINYSGPKGSKQKDMLLLKEAMEAVDFEDILISSTGGIGTNWANVKDYRVPGDL